MNSRCLLHLCVACIVLIKCRSVSVANDKRKNNEHLISLNVPNHNQRQQLQYTTKGNERRHLGIVDFISTTIHKLLDREITDEHSTTSSNDAVVTEDYYNSTPSDETGDELMSDEVQEDATVATASDFPLRIDCGSISGYLDKDNQWWKKDVYYQNGVRLVRDSVTLQYNNTPNSYPKIYYSLRRTPDDGPLLYEIPVPIEGSYTVVLHFVEFIYKVIGKRIFNLYIEGSPVPHGQNIDIVKVAGGPNIPYLIRRRTYVSDGYISIQLQSVNNTNATIAGIEIIQHSASPTTITTPVSVPVTKPVNPPNTVKGGISAFKLIYVPNNTEMVDLNNSTVINVNQYPSIGFNIRAVVYGNVSSINFLQNQNFEGNEPYSYCGDRAGVFFTCPDLVPSSNTNKRITITAASFSGPFQSGVAFPNATISFRMVYGAKPPSSAPTIASAPKPSPITAPTPRIPTAPRPVPVVVPVPVPVVSAPNSVAFYPILVNVGGGDYTDLAGRKWSADQLYSGGTTFVKKFDIAETEDDTIYTSERYGVFTYTFDIPVGNYGLVLHFAENFFNTTGERLFNIVVNDHIAFENVDILKLTDSTKHKAVTLEATEVVSDSVLKIEFARSIYSLPKVCGIEIHQIGPHLAHAVINGPYTAVDTDNDGYSTIIVDGTPSHTHATNAELIQWVWKHDGKVVGNGETTNITLPVGKQVVTLFVLDDNGNDAAEYTTVTVSPFGYPALSSISPQGGNVTGNEFVTLVGSGFNYNTGRMVVHFGKVQLTGSAIRRINANTIVVRSPLALVATPVRVYVQTPLGNSNELFFTYINGDPISFRNVRLTDLYGPTTLTFGPDEKLYVGTVNGYIYKFTLDDRFYITETIVSSVIKDLEDDRERVILGMTFDPMDTSSTPTLYVSHCLTFHGETNSSSGLAINGKVSRVLGANLDVVEDVVTGLPVSDHDHAVNGIEFGDEGQLYIQVGGNTNAGVIGALSASHIQKDNVLSSATLVAYLSDPNFDGVITYDADDDGNMKSGFGVEIFAYGNRNPFDLVLHSNGYLYGTDNGADIGYGDRSIGCGFGEELPELQQDDKINLLQKGKYYGHANRKRGLSGDPRQCVFYDYSHPGDANYTRPIVVAPSSANGIIEFQTNHFNGQLRGNLIYSKYKDGMYRVILTEDGTGVIPQSDPPIFLAGNYGLDVTQAPDGKLVDARFIRGMVTYYAPIEASTTTMIVKGVFPRRGPSGGGSNLNVYGINFSTTTAKLVVTVGDSNCPIVSTTARKIVCTLPGGTGTVNVTVTTTIGRPTSIFQSGYRYISGQPTE